MSKSAATIAARRIVPAAAFHDGPAVVVRAGAHVATTGGNDNRQKRQRQQATHGKDLSSRRRSTSCIATMKRLRTGTPSRQDDASLLSHRAAATGKINDSTGRP